MTSLPSRSTLRDSLETDLKTISWATGGTPPVTVTPLADVTGGGVTTPHVFKYWKKNPNGISPFACIDSGSVRYNTVGSDEIPTPMVMVIGFWARRDDSDGHDDMLDGLARGLAQVLRANYNAKFVSQSASDYEVLDGTPYKFELHFVEFQQVV